MCMALMEDFEEWMQERETAIEKGSWVLGECSVSLAGKWIVCADNQRTLGRPPSVKRSPMPHSLMPHMSAECHVLPMLL